MGCVVFEMGRFCPFLADDEVVVEAWVFAFGEALVVAFVVDWREALVVAFAVDLCEA
jgi:hypothetical protein